MNNLLLISAISWLALGSSIGATAPANDFRTILTDYSLAGWTEANGLPSSQVWAIVQDQDGYLWLGTSGGLIRFDGVKFVSGLTTPDSDLPTKSVRALVIAHDGSLWIGFGSDGGVSRMNGRQVVNYSADDGGPAGVVRTMIADSAGAIWVGSNLGLWRFQEGRWSAVAFTNSSIRREVLALFEDRERNLWVSASVGIFRRDATTLMFHPHSSGRQAEAINQNAGGSLVVTGSGQAIRTLDHLEPSPYPSLDSVTGSRLLFDRQGTTWVGTAGQGLMRLGSPGAAGRHDSESLTESDGLTGDIVRSLLEDSEGNIWIGTENGLNRLTKNVVASLPTRGDQRMNGLSGMTVARNGHLWVGTSDGVYTFSGDSLEYGRPAAFLGTPVSALHTDREGTIWAGTPRGIARMVGNRLEYLPISEPARLGGSQFIASDRHGDLWLSGSDHLFQWKSGRLAVVSNKQPRSILVDRQDRVWVGYFNGTLDVFQNGAVREYSDKDGLTGGTVSTIYEAVTGDIWVGTTQGLNRFRNERWEHVTRNRGIPGNIVEAIIEDQDGHLWIAGGPGVARIAVAEFDRAIMDASYRMQYRLYDAFDGLVGRPSPRGHPEIAKTGDGAIWFFTSNGVSMVNPRRATKSRFPPPMRIENAFANENRLDLISKEPLAPRTARVQIDYTALSFSAPTKITFRYRLEGFDTNWVEADTRRQALYTNLPPGDYRFQVLANNDGVWSEAPAVWQFSIAPALYQTRSFLVLCAIGLALAIAAAWRMRLRRVRKEFSLVIGERTRIAREIHDTLLQGFVGLSLQYNALSLELATAPEAAQERCERLRDRIESLIREARQSIWDLRSPALASSDLATALRRSGQSLAAANAVQFAFSVKGAPPSVRDLRVEESLLRIGQEAVTNAVRHASATMVEVELGYEIDSVTLRVSDNGQGFDPGDPTFSVNHWGIGTMQERAEVVGGQFALRTRAGGGTEVETFIPLVDNRTKAN